jgi:hypothetical protein
MKFIIFLSFTLLTSCSTVYKSIIGIRNPSNIDEKEFISTLNNNIGNEDFQIIDMYILNDDTNFRIKSFGSSIINHYQIFDDDGITYKPISGINQCNADIFALAGMNPSKYLQKADTNKIKQDIDFLVFKTVNSLLSNTRKVNSNDTIYNSKKTIVLFWSFFANKESDVQTISRNILKSFSKDSFQFIRVNCDLINSKFKGFNSKIKNKGSVSNIEIDFLPFD